MRGTTQSCVEVTNAIEDAICAQPGNALDRLAHVCTAFDDATMDAESGGEEEHIEIAEAIERSRAERDLAAKLVDLDVNPIDMAIEMLFLQSMKIEKMLKILKDGNEPDEEPMVVYLNERLEKVIHRLGIIEALQDKELT
jgi:hypothetical protein